MGINEIIEKLNQLGFIDNEAVEYKKLSGGTSSSVYVLYKNSVPTYVMKINDCVTIKYETQFLRSYSEQKLLPKVLYVDRGYNFFLYSYINGETQSKNANKKAFLTTLVKDFINNYTRYSDFPSYGYLDEPITTWRGFLLNEALEARGIIKDILSKEDHDLVTSLINSTNNKIDKYLLHGDCGIHNFLFSEGHLVGVIDPTPVVGLPLYDLIYAYCSSPVDLDYNTIQQATRLLNISYRDDFDLEEEVLKGLYIRIGTCIKHHPHHLNEYLQAWEYWKKRII
jgi:aminoglycoside phosphotransferase